MSVMRSPDAKTAARPNFTACRTAGNSFRTAGQDRLRSGKCLLRVCRMSGGALDSRPLPRGRNHPSVLIMPAEQAFGKKEECTAHNQRETGRRKPSQPAQGARLSPTDPPLKLTATVAQ